MDEPNALNSLPTMVLMYGEFARACLDSARESDDPAEAKALLEEADGYLRRITEAGEAAIGMLEKRACSPSAHECDEASAGEAEKPGG